MQLEIEVSEFEENELEQAVLEWEEMQREVFLIWIRFRVDA